MSLKDLEDQTRKAILDVIEAAGSDTREWGGNLIVSTHRSKRSVSLMVGLANVKNKGYFIPAQGSPEVVLEYILDVMEVTPAGSTEGDQARHGFMYDFCADNEKDLLDTVTSVTATIKNDIEIARQAGTQEMLDRRLPGIPNR